MAAQGALPDTSSIAHTEPQKDSGLGGTREGALRKREGSGLKRRGLVASQCRSSLTPWHPLSQLAQPLPGDREMGVMLQRQKERGS